MSLICRCNPSSMASLPSSGKRSPCAARMRPKAIDEGATASSMNPRARMTSAAGSARKKSQPRNGAGEIFVTAAAKITRATVSATNRVGRVRLTRGNVDGSRQPGNKTPETGRAGWGTWIRTRINGVRVLAASSCLPRVKPGTVLLREYPGRAAHRHCRSNRIFVARNSLRKPAPV
jgi:hypothetical protein